MLSTSILLPHRRDIDSFWSDGWLLVLMLEYILIKNKIATKYYRRTTIRNEGNIELSIKTNKIVNLNNMKAGVAAKLCM